MKIATRIKSFKVKVLKAPLNQPFRTALGQHDYLENVMFEIVLVSGIKGCGEAAIATHITGETISQTIANLQKIGALLIDRDVADYLALSFLSYEILKKNKAALAAVEMAVIDALTRQLKIPLWQFFGIRPTKLKTDITIVIADLEETIQTTKNYFQRGFRAFKIKIGRDFDLDVKRVVAIKKIVGQSQIILDANQGYDAQKTLKFLKTLNQYKIIPHLLEQPVHRDDWEGLKRVKRLSNVLICADESVRSLAEAVRAIDEKAVDVINIKLMKTGLIESREIALLAKANGMKLMIGGMMETSLAMTAAAHFASGLGGFDFVDLDTPFFLKEGTRAEKVLSSSGKYDLSKIMVGII